MRPLTTVKRIVLLYLVFAALWVIFSDLALEAVAANDSQIHDFQTYKGLLFIFLTGGVMYLLLNREFKRRTRIEKELRNLNMQLEERIDARTQELAAANERLTKLYKAQRNTIRDVSHALRTPLTTMNMRIELMDRVETERLREYIPGLRVQIELLSKMVINLLDLSRIEMDTQEVVDVDLNAIIERAIEAHIGYAQDHNLSLEFTHRRDLPSIEGHPDQLVMMVDNIVQNSLKYTAKGGVTIHAAPKGNHCVELRIQDTGRGIKSEHLKHVFDRFYRAPDAVSSGVPGTGLGLVIVKEIIDRHHGKIDIKSEPGDGTTFTIDLPCKQPDASPLKNEARTT